MVARFAFAVTWVIAVYVSGIAIEAKSLSGKSPGEPPLTGDSAQSTKPPPSVQNAEPAMWVQSRQYTGRIVTVSNDKIFDQPVYNYTRDFPYIWEEISVPISYDADRERAEKILLQAAERHTVSIAELSDEALREMQRRYFVKPAT